MIQMRIESITRKPVSSQVVVCTAVTAPKTNILINSGTVQSDSFLVGVPSHARTAEPDAEVHRARLSAITIWSSAGFVL